MSDFPGFPSPFSTWNQFTSARTTFPTGNLPVPGLVPGLSNVPLQEPGLFQLRQASLPDPSSVLPPASYRALPPISTRYLPGLADIPVLGIEPSYGCSLQEPRLLLHSPNFAFSQNPSPLTFDQVYRSAGSSSVSPVSQYRNQFDQRYVNSRLLLTGRLSEPLVCEHRETKKSKEKVHHPSEREVNRHLRETHRESQKELSKDSQRDKEKGEYLKDKEALEVKHVKLWNPFESDTSKEVKLTDVKGSSYDFSIDSLTNVSNKFKDKSIDDKKGTSVNDLSKGDSESKSLPRLPIPRYPVKPVPIYDNQGSVFSTDCADHSIAVSPYTQCNITSSHSPVGPSSLHVTCNRVDGTDRDKTSHRFDKKDSRYTKLKLLDNADPEVSKLDQRDFNQNIEVKQNCNLLIVGDTQTNDVIDAVQEKDTQFEKVKSECSNENTVTKVNNGDSLDKTVDVSNTVVNDSGVHEVIKPQVDSSAGVDDIEDLDKEGADEIDQSQQEKENNVPDSGISKKNQNEIFHSKSSNANTIVPYSSSCLGHLHSVPIKTDQKAGVQRRQSVNSALKIQINLINNFEREGIKSSELKPKLCSPNKSLKESKAKLCLPKNGKNTKKEASVKDELSALSNQVNEVRKRRNSINNAFKVLSPTDDNLNCAKTFSGEVNQNTSIQNSYSVTGEMMASGGSAITMMKNSEDSLSASISSSHISESDSDTQLSTENVDKLFSESQSLNTRSMFPQNQSDGQDYMPPLNESNLNCDSSQFFKSNDPQMCQSNADNQKPYLCVQEQNQFNEKSEILPPYNCYASNQSTNVLPDGGNFQSHDDDSSNFPQSNQGMDTLDSSMDYDENSVMSESTAGQECESQLSGSHGSETLSNKVGLIEGSRCSNNPDSFLQAGEQSYQWDFLHSKQYIDNIYSKQFSCEAVKNEEQDIRYSDSPKTFIDLDTTTKEKKAQESKQEPFSKDGYSKHYGKALSRHGYSSGQRPSSQSSYGNQNFDSYSGSMSGNRWNNFSRNGNDGMMGNQSKFVGDSESGQYEHNQNQYRNSYQSGYSSLNQGQNGGDKTYNQSGFHGNDYNQSDPNYYNQNQSVKGYQGSYGNSSRYDNNYYQNKGSSDYNTQNNMFPPNSGEMTGARYGNQGYSGNQGGYSQHYTPQSSSHSGSNNMGQYSNNSSQNYNYQRHTVSPASTGGEPNVAPKKKRGRKRKIDKEPQDENKPRPNTIVVASTSIGPLIDIDNPDVPIETYDYNNQIETIFNFTVDDDLSPIGAQFLQMEQRLCQKMLPIKYGHPVNVIYCPLTYAFQTHRDFVAKFCTSERPILFLGMNPGPYGMSQNGVPFGEATVVRDWLKITGDIYKPEIEHPKKTVTGLACTRNEVSGARFWGLFQRICKVPENYFKNCYVHNFCPQAYMSESGKNITPPQLVHAELDQINEACDAGLVELVKLLNTRIIIAVGKFVQQRASKALHNAGVMNIKVECILHPSPINPHANKGWEQIVAKQLIEMNVMQYLNPDMEDVMKQIEDWEKVAQSNAKLAE